MERQLPDPHPHVSVVLPFYRPGEQLAIAVDSIIGQDFPDWELLLIANNADAVSLHIAQDRVAGDPRIRLLAEPRQGIAFALNTGLAAARGGLIARMDADDVSLPGRLAAQSDYMEQHPAIGLVACRTVFASELPSGDGYAAFVAWQNAILSPEEHALYRFIESPVAHPAVMFRRSLVEAYGAYDTGPVPEDYELWLRWMGRGVRFAKIPEPLVLWNDHAGRLSRTHTNYAAEAFYRVKCRFLAAWLAENVPEERRIIIFGTGSRPRLRADLLKGHGIPIHGFTDIKARAVPGIRFIPPDALATGQKYFFVNFTSKRGVREVIRAFLAERGFIEGRDFLMGA
jgi:glycosyltransferase involved in cell wall biosynthesis